MAIRTVIPIQRVPRSTVALIGTLAAPLLGGTAIDQANGMYVETKHFNRLVLLIYNSKAGPIVVTIAPGQNPPAFEAARGALTATLQTVNFALITGLDSTRFLQLYAGMAVAYLDFDAGASGTLWAYELAA